MNLIEESIRPILGGHEKFVFRHGWLKKGVDEASMDAQIFTRDQALVKLGVGKNMVRSIRHWCLATGLLESVGNIGSTRLLQPSSLARSLLLDNGWDPYLEDVGTLWLLHWQLVSNLERGLIWYLTFSTYLETEFNKKQLIAYISMQLDQLGVRTTERSIEREVDCCLRTYVPSKNSRRGINEDSMDCPLAELELIRFFPESGSYHFNIGPKFSLPYAIFGYALLIYLIRLTKHGRTDVAIEECLYKPGSPGQAFKLDENSVVEYIEKLEQFMKGGLYVYELTGMNHIRLTNPIPELVQAQATELLRYYYERK